MKLTTTKARSKFVTALIYGKHGVGKTPLIATSPSPFIIDIDAGQMSNADLDIPMSEVRSFSDLEETYEYLTTKKAQKLYQTVILEGGWELSDIVLEELKSRLVEQAKEQNKKADPRQAYFAMAEEFKYWIRQFRDLPYHFIMTTLLDEFEVDDVLKSRAYFVGNVLGVEVPGMFNEILCLHHEDESDDESKIVLQCKPCSEYDARDRSRRLKKFEKMDLAEIINKITKDNSNGKKGKR